MMLGIFAILSLFAAGGICLGAGAFENLSWLWLLPVGFLGSFLGIVLVFFLFVLLLSALSDLEKPQEKDNKLYRIVIDWCADIVLTFARVRVHTKGLEKTPTDGRFLLVCNHLHDADPVILMKHFPRSQLAFIAKREVKEMFLIGKLMHKVLGQFVNRENDKEALRTIIRCIQILKDDLASVAVFPEGRIHPDRKFYPFRPGVFKIAQKANVPVVVCTMTNTQNVIKNFLKLKPTDVDLHLLAVIPVEEVTAVKTVELANRIHDMMAEDLGEAYRPTAVEEPEQENT